MDLLRRLLLYLLPLTYLTAFHSFGSDSGIPVKIVTEDLRPYNYLENGKLKGVGTEVVEAVLKELNLPLEIQVYPWARAFAIATNEPGTLIYTIGRSEERGNFVSVGGGCGSGKIRLIFSEQQRRTGNSLT